MTLAWIIIIILIIAASAKPLFLGALALWGWYTLKNEIHTADIPQDQDVDTEPNSIHQRRARRWEAKQRQHGGR